MGNVNPGAPRKLIAALAREFSITEFVETGTYLGETAAWAASIFPHVTTIERSDAVFGISSRRLSGLANVTAVEGDSRTSLPSIVRNLPGPALFWLDAHWSGEATYGKDDECPLLDEIASIRDAGFDTFVLIDDARLFLAPPPFPHHPAAWPDITAVLDALRSEPRSGRYVVVVDDVIASVPGRARGFVAAHCQGRATEIEGAETRRRQGSVERFVGSIKELLSAKSR